jgi:hypothetical protein
MAEAATSVAKTQSWRPLFWGLAALLVMPVLPLFEAMIPVQQTLLLLVLVVAACSIVGWKLGGRLALALIWVALSIWMLLQPAGPPGSQYDLMTRGWAILLAASFGLVSLWSTTMPFFSRALIALGLAVGIGFVIALSSPSGIARFQHAAEEELTRRVSITIQKVEEGRNTQEWQDMTARVPMVDTWNEDSETMMRLLPARAATLLPALLALGIPKAQSGRDRTALEPTHGVHVQRSTGVGAGGGCHTLPPAGVRRRKKCWLQSAAVFRRAISHPRHWDFGLDSARTLRVRLHPGPFASGFRDSDTRPRPGRYLARPSQARQSGMTVRFDPALC